jgi:Putative transmembrane protein (PGPGW)
VVGGLIAVPGPGPGWVITFLGLGLIAGEFRPVARFMDRAEVNLRALARWAVGAWSSTSTGIKVLICLAILLSLATLGYVAYYLFFSGSNFLTTLQ